MIITLTYASTASPFVSAQDVSNITRSSLRNNLKNNITGMLCYGNKKFIQCIEGDRIAINELYTTLIKDTRHSKVTLLEYKTIEERVFKNWSMGFVSAYDESVKKVIREYTNMEKFQPALLTDIQAAQLIHKLKSFLEPQVIGD